MTNFSVGVTVRATQSRKRGGSISMNLPEGMQRKRTLMRLFQIGSKLEGGSENVGQYRC